MFFLEISDEEYIERRIDWLKLQRASGTPMLLRLEQNGVLVSPVSIASYWGIPMRDASRILDMNRIHPYSTDRRLLYFRPHLWDIYPEYLAYLQRNFPDHIRLTKKLVSADDVAVFYELSRTNANRVLRNLKLTPYKNHKTSKLMLYEYDPIVKAEEERQSFSRITYYAGQTGKGSLTSGACVFRDHLCPRYDDCTDFAGWSSNFMNCSVCEHHLKRTNNTKQKPVDALAVYTPTNQAGIRKLQEFIAKRLGGDLSRLPNVL